MKVFDDRVCELGEGPLWHPERQQTFWFDILGKRLLSRSGEDQFEWAFDEHVSAAGWVDRDRLMIASETALFLFNLETGTRDHICALEADNPVTRSNDGRADPYGGFWIGTMGKALEPRKGAIYRWYRGELRRLFGPVSVSNSICFSPDGKHAYFCDTFDKQIQRVELDAEGWPTQSPEVFVDLRGESLNPDGSVVDAEGNLWNAQWGANRVAVYSPDGQLLRTVDVPGSQSSCPAFGGADLTTLFVTTAAEGLTGPNQGITFFEPSVARGQAEHRVVI